MKGKIAYIYQKPLTDEQYEGKAKIIEVARKSSTGDPMMFCKVEFLDEPGATYYRFIKDDPDYIFDK